MAAAHARHPRRVLGEAVAARKRIDDDDAQRNDDRTTEVGVRSRIPANVRSKPPLTQRTSAHDAATAKSSSKTLDRLLIDVVSLAV